MFFIRGVDRVQGNHESIQGKKIPIKLCVSLQYRSLKDLRDPEYLAPRIVDKIIFSLIIMSL